MQSTFDALGRRIEKVVSNSGDLDGTFRFWYNDQRLIEMRDGSNDVHDGAAPVRKRFFDPRSTPVLDEVHERDSRCEATMSRVKD